MRIQNGINDGNFFLCLGLIDFGFLVSCGCADFRDIDCLAFILNLCMNCNFLSVCIQGFKDNQCLSCKCGCVKGKDNINTSILLFRSEDGFGCYLFVIDKQRLSGFLIHQDSLKTILAADFQSLIGYGIDNSCLFLCACYMILCIPAYCRGMDTWYINGLVLIGDIRMNGNFDALVLQMLESNNGSRNNSSCIKCKDHVNASVRCFRSEGSFCGNRLVID